jgi:hypothetical protein
MNFKEVTKKFFSLEKELHLFKMQVGGVCFWEFVRYNIYIQILQKSGVHSQAHSKLEVDARIRRNYIFNAIKNIFCKNPFFAPESDILFLGSPRRKLMDDQLWWDIHSDPVVEKLGDSYSCALMESPFLNFHLSPVKTDNIMYLDLMIFLETVLTKTKIVQFRLSQKDDDNLRDLEKHIYDKFNTQIDLKEIVSSKLLSRKILLPLYSYLIKKINPKVVIVLIGYGNKICIEACKNLHIPVVELQHGAASGRYHLGYSFPDEKVKTRAFPDYLLVFGDFWKNRCRYPIDDNRVIPVGFPFFEMEARKFSQECKKEQIVFISQGTIGEKMSRFALELKARKDFSLDIIYKLHPGEYARWKKEYPWLVDSNITVLDDDAIPLYKLLAQSKVLVGVYSTVVYEALGFGLRTFLLDLPGIDYMEELIESQVVNVVSTVDELVEKIKKPGLHQESMENFFKPNALENISNALERITLKNV